MSSIQQFALAAAWCIVAIPSTVLMFLIALDADITATTELGAWLQASLLMALGILPACFVAVMLYVVFHTWNRREP